MSPLRCSRAARPSLTLHRAPLALLAASLFTPLFTPFVAVALLACSSADSGVNDSSSSVVSTSPSQTGESGEGDDTSQQESAGGESTGNDSASAGGDGSTSGADPSGTPPDAPEPEPGVDDLLESETPLVPGCDLEHPLQLQLRTLDAGAASSPAQARDAALGGWVSLTGIGIRAWEFFNYYTFDYPAAAQPGAVVISPGLAQDADGYTLQVGIRTHNLAAELRPPVHLTLALDNSGSMQGKAQDLVRITGEAIAASLREGDIVSIVTWNSTDQVVLDAHPVSGPADETLLAKLDALEVGGSADLYSGLVGAYKLAEAAYDPTAWNRVILISDGGASVNESDLEVIANHPKISLTGVGVGDPGIYRSDLMDAVAHAGRGSSLFIGGESEATRQFVDRFVPIVGAAVRDVVVHVQLPPGFELIRDDDAGALADDSVTGPNVRLGPGRAFVVHRRFRSCADPLDTSAKLTVKVQYIDEQTGSDKETWTTATLGQLLAEDSGALRKGAAIHAYARLLTRWQASPVDLAESLTDVLTRLEAAQKLLPNDPELAEISAVLAVLGSE
jgi:Ca-activated chloride channel family protein